MRSSLLFAAGVTPVLCDTHYFFSGFFSGTAIVGVEFDEAASTLTLANNITTSATSGSKWIAIDVGGPYIVVRPPFVNCVI